MIIYKYELQITDRQIIETGPYPAYPLTVAEQGGKLMLWAMVDKNNNPPGSDKYGIFVQVIGTGNPFNANTHLDAKYLGTVLMSNGLVWHVITEAFRRGD